MINNVILTGRLTKDCEQRSTAAGTMVATFTLAVDNATKEPSTSFIPCSAFDKAATAVINYTHKGSLIGVIGSLRQRSYQAQDGTTRSVFEVIVNRVELLEPKKADEENELTEEPVNKPVETPAAFDDELPF